MKNVEILVVFIIFMFSFSCAVMTGGTEDMIKENAKLKRAIEQGKMEIKKLGLDIGKMRIIADENNAAWKEYIEKNPSVIESNNIKKMRLNEKKFWAIYFHTEELMFGGDAWVFIDKIDGSTIGVILGE